MEEMKGRGQKGWFLGLKGGRKKEKEKGDDPPSQVSPRRSVVGDEFDLREGVATYVEDIKL